MMMMIRRSPVIVRKALFRRSLFHEAKLQPSSRILPAAGGVASQQEDNPSRLVFAAAAAAAFGTLAATTVVCCNPAEENNPLWPSGISEEDLDHFVDSVLKDSSINMSAIPDVVERTIYKSTVSITANLIYEALSGIQGIQFHGHKLKLRRNTSKEGFFESDHLGIDEKILEDVADRLLANSSINQTLVPDYIERQLYVNCLKLIFKLLDTVAASFCITFCGHDVLLTMKPSAKKNLLAVSSMTKVNVAELQAIARKQLKCTGLYGEFQAQLQATLNALLLGIVDDLLANTEIAILSDRVGIDIVPAKKGAVTQAVTNIQEASGSASRNGGFLLPFGLGIGIGAATMALLMRN